MSENYEYIIEFSDVHKSFNSNHVHRGINLKIKKGENICILGGSGSGKSVILKELCGLIDIDKGKIFVEGEDITTLDEEQILRVRKKIGMLFQGSALFDSLDVYENIAFPIRQNFDYPEDKIESMVKQNLEIIGLKGIEDKYPSDLSGGMKKRVALARALAMNPKILLYDEPTTGLDPINIKRINELMRDMQYKFGMTGIIITHDIISSAFEVSDKIAFLYEGRIIFCGSVEETKNSQIKELRDFIEGRYN
ncbi:MAG: ABC transporter ATP-binding protein [Candidatus Dadabacteria bacterium]|nr:ABC transporter ATP-binding protein [Candidatus Dadabacteria bacterium]NIS09557.1 ABC transporter ATP-binding protein [Candidatus Dadabacteria bacterium]NIV43066.1 ATP-binding cassette domain-containing protein [Candidatus Dadabacteria bacterium]NIX16031.1 ATP-binding cassette domain-containing protein [Candidatus Dadabacteria bacterium]NIY22734.1 ATP-binding cassette domain-containing protein [Candidatus Dadabacteria bacterium]